MNEIEGNISIQFQQPSGDMILLRYDEVRYNLAEEKYKELVNQIKLPEEEIHNKNEKLKLLKEQPFDLTLTIYSWLS